MNYTGMNTDKEIWRKIPGDYYSPSIHVTEFDGVGINVGGHVLVAPIEEWHKAGNKYLAVPDPNDLITSRSTLTAKARTFFGKLLNRVRFCSK